MSGYVVGRPTQFLVLLNLVPGPGSGTGRALAGRGEVLQVYKLRGDAKTSSRNSRYRLQKSCGPDAALETADANRAFLTVNSGFPLADLEDSLREGKPFETPYAPTKVPILYKTSDWVPSKKKF